MDKLFAATSLLTIATLLASCGASRANEEPPAYSGNGASPLCSYVGLEMDSAPQHDNVDSVALVATYRLRESGTPPPREPIELKFQVQRSRVDELRGRLEAHPDVICRPDNASHYQVESAELNDFGVEPR